MSFAEKVIKFSDGQTNVSEPPAAILEGGFRPQTSDARGSPLAAQWLNWIFRDLYRLVGLDHASRGIGAGTGVFRHNDCSIRLEAIDLDDPNKYLVAIGYKGGVNDLHVLKVISSSGLTLGTPTLNGNQPVLGGTNVLITGYSRKIEV